MAMVIMLCGKACSGKTAYANKVKDKYNAVVLSYDELIDSLLGQQEVENYNELVSKAKTYLYKLTEQMIALNTNVILDFGFWSYLERKEVADYFKLKNIKTELHYIKISDEEWRKQIEKRNEDTENTDGKGYYIDHEMKHTLHKKFEEPNINEISFVIEL